MKRYRIEQYGGIYYPQHTLGLFWWVYYFKDIGYETSEVIRFNSYQEAKDFIKNSTRKVHKVDI